MDGVPMHRARITEKIMRVAATDGEETWIYQFHEPLWRQAVRRIMEDAKQDKLPEMAAGGMLEMIAEGIADAD
jgi:hypothetical protein